MRRTACFLRCAVMRSRQGVVLRSRMGVQRNASFGITSLHEELWSI
jgi:hypothetical protein